jgi:hypothetical protein
LNLSRLNRPLPWRPRGDSIRTNGPHRTPP